MPEPRLHHVVCPDAGTGHRMAYWDWGDASARHVVVCVHGLTRQGRDFDVLARALVSRSAGAVRVICPDVVGRGHSDWLADPQGYRVPHYVPDMRALLASLPRQVVSVDWVGTSMGGLIGMMLCGQDTHLLAHAVRRLVLNDVGPVIEWSAIARIGAYLGHLPRFDSLQAAAAAMWTTSSTFGPHTPEQWLELSRHMVKPVPGVPGALTLHYDPGIAVPFATMTPEAAEQELNSAMLWGWYDNIRAQTLLVRGAESDLLSPTTAQQMTQRGPKAQLVQFAGVGHAPTLIAPDQVQAVTDFLLQP